MARVIEAFAQFSDKDGNPLPGGQLLFFETNTSTKKDTFSDFSETNPNTNPVILDGEGRAPDIFGTGSYKVQLYDKDGLLIDEFDPVGGTDSLIPFSDWSSDINYQQYAIVQGSDGEFYISEVDDNLNNDPVSDSGANWQQIRFLGVWKTGTTYDVGDVVQTAEGFLWRSLTSPNQGNDPNADDGTNWSPAIDQTKVKTIPLTGGGALTAGRINEIQDTDTYTMPLANSVAANTILQVTLPLPFRAETPTIERSGADTLSFDSGTDTSFQYNGLTWGPYTFISDGSSDWRLT